MKQKLLYLAVLCGMSMTVKAQTNVFPTDGNVGIGTANPSKKFDINDCSGAEIIGRFIGGVLSGGNNYSSVEFGSLGDTYGKSGHIGYLTNNADPNSSGIYLVNYGENELFTSLFIKRGGNVGIGTGSPQGKLDVNGEILSRGYNAGFRVFSSAGDNINQAPWYGIGASNLVLSNNPVGAIQLAGYFGLNLQTSAGQIVLLSNGNAGIGTTNPDQKLTVKGKIHAEEVIVDLNVPADYVFAKDYSLMPLHKVEQYVKTNSHLPDVPSATEIKNKGLSMGEMQNKLLQKIEELTLYAIEQNKQISQQNQQLSKQNQRIEQLENQLREIKK